MKKPDKPRKPMGDENGLSPLGKQMIAGADAFIAAMEADPSIAKRLTSRTTPPQPSPRSYSPEDVKAVRGYFRASQGIFADFLGVSRSTLQSWEQGTRPVPGIASRYLDDLLAFPQIWERRARKAVAE